VPVKYSSLDPVADDVQQVLSLIAHAASNENAIAFAQGIGEAGLDANIALIEARNLNVTGVTQSLGRLNQLGPQPKSRLVKALVQTALADGKLTLMEAELLRAICATLDCPLPPFVEAMEYAA
jgi:uncharacterized tellurite resistance protein B-like protein